MSTRRAGYAISTSRRRSCAVSATWIAASMPRLSRAAPSSTATGSPSTSRRKPRCRSPERQRKGRALALPRNASGRPALLGPRGVAVGAEIRAGLAALLGARPAPAAGLEAAVRLARRLAVHRLDRRGVVRLRLVDRDRRPDRGGQERRQPVRPLIRDLVTRPRRPLEAGLVLTVVRTRAAALAIVGTLILAIAVAPAVLARAVLAMVGALEVLPGAVVAGEAVLPLRPVAPVEPVAALEAVAA